MELRWNFDGTSMGVRRNSGFFASRPQTQPAHSGNPHSSQPDARLPVERHLDRVIGFVMADAQPHWPSPRAREPKWAG
jgi:hypothetical protein